jgi:hypothetical protein
MTPLVDRLKGRRRRHEELRDAAVDHPWRDLRPDGRCSHGDLATATRMFFPAGDYRHAPAGVVQLRVIRGGWSYAEIDLGSGLRRVLARPRDRLLSLPGRATRFKIEEPRELTMITIGVAAYHHVGSRTVERRCGHYNRPWRRKAFCQRHDLLAARKDFHRQVILSASSSSMLEKPVKSCHGLADSRPYHHCVGQDRDAVPKRRRDFACLVEGGELDVQIFGFFEREHGAFRRPPQSRQKLQRRCHVQDAFLQRDVHIRVCE